MNLLEIFGVIIVLSGTALFWIMVFDDDAEAGSLGLALIFAWVFMVMYFKDFFTTPLW